MEQSTGHVRGMRYLLFIGGSLGSLRGVGTGRDFLLAWRAAPAVAPRGKPFAVLAREHRARGRKAPASVPKCDGGPLDMAKKSRGGRMTAAKKRAAKRPGGRGLVKNRKAGQLIMKT